jgi:hypothetical protein
MIIATAIVLPLVSNIATSLVELPAYSGGGGGGGVPEPSMLIGGDGDMLIGGDGSDLIGGDF